MEAESVRGNYLRRMQEERGVLSLSELSAIVAGIFSMHFSGERFWVTADIIGLKLSRGHCYLQLAEKDEFGSTPKAEFRGIIWASTYDRLAPRFFRSTGSPLRESIRVLMQVEVQYHERYGLSLLVSDIDPAYTLGQIEMERRQTIEKLKKEGLYDRNKELKLPASLQRIAVISAEDSKGYEDFITRLETNVYGYTFDYRLYTSLLQGDLAAGDIIAKLQRIKADMPTRRYDAVVIVRGGGGASSLECFNNYLLAEAIAKFPLPVITGIGHQANKSVVDEVAHTDRMTPTDVANFLIEHQVEYEETVESYWAQIRDMSLQTFQLQQEFLSEATHQLQQSVRQGISEAHRFTDQATFSLRHQLQAVLLSERNILQNSQTQLQRNVRQQFLIDTAYFDQCLIQLRKQSLLQLQRNDERLQHQEKQLRMLDPAEILKRGYSYTLHQGKIITDTTSLKEGEEITTVLYKGEIISTINTLKDG